MQVCWARQYFAVKSLYLCGYLGILSLLETFLNQNFLWLECICTLVIHTSQRYECCLGTLFVLYLDFSQVESRFSRTDSMPHSQLQELWLVLPQVELCNLPR